MQDSKNRTETGQRNATLSGFKRGKDHILYWKDRIQKREFSWQGNAKEVNEWQVRLWHQRREGWFNLGTENRDAAATKARDIYRFLKVNGWEVTLLKFKGPVVDIPETITLGQYIEAARAVSNVSACTFEQYARRTRSIVAALTKETKSAPLSKHDYVSGGTAAWRKKIDAFPLQLLTVDRIETWKKAFVAAKSADPLKKRASEVTANSHLRNAKALFSDNVVKRLKHLPLPKPLPFVEVGFFKQTTPRYRSTIEPIQLLIDAKEDFKEKPELYKIFLLSLLVGLRRNEIDKLKWDAINWDLATIRVQRHESFSPKADSSEGDVPIEPELLEILRKSSTGAKGEFVIESDVEPQIAPTVSHYRCNKLFDNLITWLRSKGVGGHKPIHTLRKEYGRLITEKHGIFAASKLLRHSSISITAAYYADDTRHLTVGLGSTLGIKSEEKISSGEKETHRRSPLISTPAMNTIS